MGFLCCFSFRCYYLSVRTLKEIAEDATTLERKWSDENQPFVETRRTPDLENMDLEQYQQSIAQ